MLADEVFPYSCIFIGNFSRGTFRYLLTASTIRLFAWCKMTSQSLPDSDYFFPALLLSLPWNLAYRKFKYLLSVHLHFVFFWVEMLIFHIAIKKTFALQRRTFFPIRMRHRQICSSGSALNTAAPEPSPNKMQVPRSCQLTRWERHSLPIISAVR